MNFNRRHHHQKKKKVKGQWTIQEPINVNDSMIQIFVDGNVGFNRVYNVNVRLIRERIPILCLV